MGETLQNLMVRVEALEWKQATDVTMSADFPAFNAALQQRSSSISSNTLNHRHRTNSIRRSLMQHWQSFGDSVLQMQMDVLMECKFLSELPDSTSWQRLTLSMQERNIFVSNRRTDLFVFDGDTHTESYIINDLARKYKALAASIVYLRVVTQKTNEGLRSFLATVRLWHAWYVSETIQALALFPADTFFSLDTKCGTGEYIWNIIAVASTNDIDRLVSSEPSINASVKQQSAQYMPLFQRRTGCNGVRLELCQHYLHGVLCGKIKRLPYFEDRLSSLPCHKADNGAMVWDEESFLANSKAKLGLPLFFSCDARACCTTLCMHGLDVFLRNTTHTAARSLLQMPIRYSSDCPYQAEAILTVFMATHPRLGQFSALAAIPPDILRLICTNLEIVHEDSGISKLHAAASSGARGVTRTSPQLQAMFRLLSIFSDRTEN